MDNNLPVSPNPVVPPIEKPVSQPSLGPTAPNTVTPPIAKPNPVVTNPQPASTADNQLQIQFPPVLWTKTQNLIKEIEQKIQSKTLVYFTRPTASICDDDVDYFFSHVRDLQSESSIALILISNGGSGMAGWRIAYMLRNFCQTLTLIAPSRCASAATLMALSADKILFGPAGYLTAIDTSLTYSMNPRPAPNAPPARVSVDQVKRIEDFINNDLKIHPTTKSLSEILFDKIHPLVLGELDRTSSLSKMVAKNMMKLRKEPPTEEEQNRIAGLLNDSYPTHGYPIVLKEALQIGLPAEPAPIDLNSALWEIVKLYSLASKRVTTNFDPTFYHIEEVQSIIESTGKRTFFNNSLNRRRVGIEWFIENDKSRWLSAVPDPENPERAKFSEIEL